MVGLMRMNRILDIDYADRCAVVQAGVTNIGITGAVAGQGFFYAPDPSSQLACMIGGNVAMNSGGAHCLKYGVTTNNLLGLKLVTVEGEIIDIGGAHLDAAGYDWLGLLCGSEGQLAVVTEVTVRILRGPEGARAMLAAFASNEVAGACVDGDHRLRHHPGRPRIHGPPGDPCLRGLRPCRLPAGRRGDADHRGGGQPRRTGRAAGSAARDLRAPRPDQPEGLAVGRGIRGDLEGPQGRVRRDRADQPRLSLHGRRHPHRRLPEVLRRIGEISAAYGLQVANIFHAGDGNLHPLIMFDANDPASFHKAETFGADILKLCVEVGGCLTGEHGVGIEKRDLMGVQFSAVELDQQRRIKSAFDPDWLLNPAKVFPLAGAVG